VRPEGLGKLKKKSPHRVSNPRPSGLDILINISATTAPLLRDSIQTYKSDDPLLNSARIITYMFDSQQQVWKPPVPNK
jgi:hypothetical protein